MMMFRITAVFAVLGLAVVASLFVLDLIPREILQEVATKVVSIAAIVGATGLIVSLLLKRD